MRNWLRELRKRKGLTQTDVAGMLDMRASNYTMIENGKRQKDLDLSLASNIARLFGVSVDWIISQEENKL